MPSGRQQIASAGPPLLSPPVLVPWGASLTLNPALGNYFLIRPTTAGPAVVELPDVAPGTFFLLAVQSFLLVPVTLTYAAGWFLNGGAPSPVPASDGVNATGYVGICTGVTPGTVGMAPTGTVAALALVGQPALRLSAQTDVAGAAAGTLGNTPGAGGNPLWLSVERNGIAGAVPWWPV